jgi:hypothetical protein
MEIKKINNFKIKSLGKQKQTVYDIETKDNHNFFASSEQGMAKMLVHNSNYLSLEEVIKKLGLTFNSNEEFATWAKDFVDEVLQPEIDRALEDYAYEYGFKNIIKFKREKIIKDMFVVAGKNYALSVLEDEKGNTWYDDPDIKITGIPVKKKTAQKIAQDHLPHVLNMIMNREPKEKIAEYLRPVKEEFLNSEWSFDEIFIAGKVNEFSKYDYGYEFMKEHGMVYKSRAAFKIKGAINHNYILKDKNINTIFALEDGVMCKSAYVYPTNEYGIGEISWEDKYPKEFEGLFEIDKYTMWTKGIMAMLDKWCEVLGWSPIKMIENTTDDLF